MLTYYKIKLSVILVLATYQLLAQTDVLSEIRTFPPGKYERIVNTNIYIVPPDGFDTSIVFPGYVLNDTTFISCRVFEDKDELAKLPTIDCPAKPNQGFTLKECKKIKVNEVNGIYFVVQDEKKRNTYQLIFGNALFRVVLIAVASDKDKDSIKKIISSLNSIFYATR